MNGCIKEEIVVTLSLYNLTQNLQNKPSRLFPNLNGSCLRQHSIWSLSTTLFALNARNNLSWQLWKLKCQKVGLACLLNCHVRLSEAHSDKPPFQKLINWWKSVCTRSIHFTLNMYAISWQNLKMIGCSKQATTSL